MLQVSCPTAEFTSHQHQQQGEQIEEGGQY